MYRKALFLVPAFAAALATDATAQPVELKGIRIEHAFATATVGGARTGGVYLDLNNTTRRADRLVSASTPRAKRVELHTMTMQGDVMRMREVEAIDLAAGTRLSMQPGKGFHLMLVDLAAPLKAGERFPMTLRFESAGQIEITVTVQDAGGSRPHATHHPHAAHGHAGH